VVIARAAPAGTPPGRAPHLLHSQATVTIRPSPMAEVGVRGRTLPPPACWPPGSPRDRGAGRAALPGRPDPEARKLGHGSDRGRRPLVIQLPGRSGLDGHLGKRLAHPIGS